MSMQFFPFLAALAFIGGLHAAPEKPNVLILYADDWRFDTLGIAGNPIVKTPNLDALAKDGIRFPHNCVTTSICGISRATLWSGQWMSRHGATDFKELRKPWSDSYPGILRANGYYTGHIGKWHNGKFPQEHFDFGRMYHGKHWIKEKDGTMIHVTQKNENDALEFLKDRPTEKPFVLTLAFFATHAEDENPLQFLPQEKSMSLYNDVEIPVPPTANEASLRKLPEFLQNPKNEGRNRWTWRFDTPEKFQTMMKNYYRLATEVDETCGKIIAELKRQGIYENTLIIFTTDNGYFHAEHGLADKWYPHQESIRVPLIIRDPRMSSDKRGGTNDEFTLNVDLAPTILRFAGFDPPEVMQGRDISELYLKENVTDWRTEFFYEHPTLQNKDFIPSSQALVRKDWKYFYWPDFEREQLFHIVDDPFEQTDLSAVPKHADKLHEMRKRFNELREAAR
jgi:arylsulfatase